MRKRIIVYLLCCLTSSVITAQPKTKIYLFPGQGADHRLFNKLSLDSNLYETIHVHYPHIDKHILLREFALSLRTQIDTTQPFVLLGVSLGGMMCAELSTVLHPQKTIIISSAKSRKEFPRRYRFMKVIPLYKLFPKRLIKAAAFVAQPLVEPDRNKEKETFKAMLRAHDAHYFKQSIRLIMTWERTVIPNNIFHIHGTKDHTLPYRKLKATHTVDKGSHMMILTRGEELSNIINKILSE